jgi:uncharacterized protein (UPF0305 family)
MFRLPIPGRKKSPDLPGTIRAACGELAVRSTRGELGSAIAEIVLDYSPGDLQQMRWNFADKIRDINPAYRRELEESITAHLHGTYQELRLMQQQGRFAQMPEPVLPEAKAYWAMVAAHCASGTEDEIRLRFLKFLLAGFCMLVLRTPGHPVGMPFPGGDRVEVIDGVYYCPVRTRANDVDEALCPFCPALQTPEVGYLRPPVKASEHRKQEYIDHIHKGHHFNG